MPELTAEQNDALARLDGALPTAEYIAGKFPDWLESWAQAARNVGVFVDVEDMDKAKLLELKLEFETGFLSVVHPQDIIAITRLVKTRTKIVQDLLMGSLNAKKFDKEGKPNKVAIKASDLKHLLEKFAKGD